MGFVEHDAKSADAGVDECVHTAAAAQDFTMLGFHPNLMVLFVDDMHIWLMGINQTKAFIKIVVTAFHTYIVYETGVVL